MPSMIAWLDASREDQRRMREIVNLFTQSESRDELGIGQVRDVFSDSLFPGTSTLRTRAGRYRDLLQKWAQECEANDGKLSACDRDAFWDFILAMNPQVRPVTRKFLSTWFDRVCRLEIHQAADDEALRRLVARRERAQKGSQSRLTNPRLLAAWSGQSGTRRLTYRWDQANRTSSNAEGSTARIPRASTCGPMPSGRRTASKPTQFSRRGASTGRARAVLVRCGMRRAGAGWSGFPRCACPR